MSNRKAVSELSDAEEARIQAGIAADPDNPEWTEEDFRKARPFAEVFPELAERIRREGVTIAGDPEENVPVSLDRRVVEKFKQQGADWQDRINEVLRKAVGL